jgi:hypothetical protein
MGVKHRFELNQGYLRRLQSVYNKRSARGIGGAETVREVHNEFGYL